MRLHSRYSKLELSRCSLYFSLKLATNQPQCKLEFIHLVAHVSVCLPRSVGVTSSWTLGRITARTPFASPPKISWNVTARRQYGDSQLSGAARTELGGTGTVSWAELGRAAWGEMGGAGRSWAYRVYQFMNQVSIFGVGLWSFATWLQWEARPQERIKVNSSRVWQSYRVRYLFFTSYGLARSTTCRSLSMLQVSGQSTYVSLHIVHWNSATLIEKEKMDLYRPWSEL